MVQIMLISARVTLGTIMAMLKDSFGSSCLKLLLLISSGTIEGKADAVARISRGVTRRTKGSIVYSTIL